ncbi:MAG TPA: DUF222 domain-containing protein [Iamia sp.]
MATVMLDSPPVTAPDDPLSLLAVSVRELTDDGVAAHLTDLHRLRAVVDAAVVEATGVFDARSAWARDGARSGPSWVAAHCPSSHGAAKDDLRLDRDLRAMPATAAAFGVGRIGREQARLLARCRTDGLEEAFAACEEVLVDEVARSTVAAGARFLRRWQAEVRERFGLAEGDGPAPAAGDRSRVHLSCSFEGRWVLDGTLDAESGEIVANAVDAQVDAMFTDGVFHADDGLLPSERRAIALVELVTRGARGGDDDGTARPLVLGVVHLDGECGAPAPLPTLAGHLGRVPADLFGLAELEHAGLVDWATAARWICEGDVQVIEVGHDDHDDLRMGRKIRLANRSQRRALRIRDGGCVFPGCSVDPSHCVAHHVRWWEWGGETDLDNLVLVCRFHHQAIHQRGFVMTRDQGRVRVTRPDGQPLREPLQPRPDPTLRPTRCRVGQRSRGPTTQRVPTATVVFGHQ